MKKKNKYTIILTLIRKGNIKGTETMKKDKEKIIKKDQGQERVKDQDKEIKEDQDNEKDKDIEKERGIQKGKEEENNKEKGRHRGHVREKLKEEEENEVDSLIENMKGKEGWIKERKEQFKEMKRTIENFTREDGKRNSIILWDTF